MTIKRAAIAAFVSVLMTVTLTACGPAENAGTPRPVDESPGDRETSGATRPAEFADEPKVAIDWQNTIVDVEPTSRFRDDQGGNDTAHVDTTLALEEEPDDETRQFLETLEGVRTEIDGRVVRMTYSFEVEEVDEDQYQFEFSAPVEFAEIEKNDDVSVVVLLPRDATEYANAPKYSVRLAGFTEETPEDDLDVLQADEAPGNRITIGLYERTDPKIGPIYIFP